MKTNIQLIQCQIEIARALVMAAEKGEPSETVQSTVTKTTKPKK